MTTISFILLRPNINTSHAKATEYNVCDKIKYHYDAILKHNVYFNNEHRLSITRKSVTIQNFFLLYEKYNK